MVTNNPNLPAIEQPIPIPSQQPIQVTQEEGISFGQLNINTQAIASYYEMFSNLASSGAELWSDLQALELKRLKWEFDQQMTFDELEMDDALILHQRGLWNFGSAYGGGI